MNTLNRTRSAQTNLTETVSNYINSWEGHTDSEGYDLKAVEEKLKVATLGEINTEYNSISQQDLWVEPLVDLFYNEILDRLMTETTFSLSVSWRSIQKPFVSVYLGFEDVYPVLDPDGSLIRLDDRTISSFTLMNDSFSDEMRERIIRILLKENILTVIQVEYAYNGRIQIMGLESSENPPERIYFADEIMNLPGVRNSQNSLITRIPLRIIETPDFNLVRRMLNGLKSGTYDIIDPFADRLINQLISTQETQDLIEEGGVLPQGEIVLDPDEKEEEDEIEDIITFS